jgi:hypothetical protein
LPHLRRRSGSLLAAVLATLFLFGSVPGGVLGHWPVGQARFMRALGEVESGGRYDARNIDSGAYGKYQIMPANWRAWARLYLGNANAQPTPMNQERVARAKIRALHIWLDSWNVVAHWWLTGSSSRDVDAWSESSRAYVQKVMTLYQQGGPPSNPPAKPGKPNRPGRRSVGDANASIVYRGGWRAARHPGYSGDTVRYAARRGASAGLTFAGRSISWVGPKGPTRGQARVYLDGRLVRTVDLRSATFQGRAVVFGHRWAKAGRHTIRIVVVGTPGRSMVAIDEFVVGA